MPSSLVGSGGGLVGSGGGSLGADTEDSEDAMTVLDLITRALRRIKVIQEGDAPSATMADDALGILEDLIDSLAGAPLTKYSVTRTTFTLTSTKGTPANPYTVGTGGDINIVRPLGFHRAAFQDNSLTTPMEYRRPLLTEAEWAAIPQKTLTGALPNGFRYEPTFPLGSLYVWMIPTTSNLVGVLYEETAVVALTALTDVVSLPPGYARFLREQLAIELWPEYRDGDVPAALLRAAKQSETQIATNNVRMSDLAVIPFVDGFYDINTDQDV